ncbi:MAG: protein phosphatase 2C domain-containing protein [Desulfobacterales bacterium]|nr:protein phosphatase 2C domain-containing protein [Desulfobacterales bacterium]
MKLRVVGKSDVGLKRKINEDKFLVAPELGLYVIADGMGGHKAGEVASGMVIETMADYWRKLRAGKPPAFLASVPDDVSEYGRHLVNSITLANIIIHEAQKKPKYRRMGSTVCALLIEKDCLWAANVGDSAIYLFDHGRLIQVSEEHSVVGEQKSMGMTSVFATTSPFLKNVLTRVVGVKESVRVHINLIQPEAGDLLLMCSDGLTNYVPEAAIKAVLDDTAISIARKVDVFIEEAYRAGGGDNITVILMEVMKESKWDYIKRKFGRKYRQ